MTNFNFSAFLNRPSVQKYRKPAMFAGGALIAGLSIWGIGAKTGWWGTGYATENEVQADSMAAAVDIYFGSVVATADTAAGAGAANPAPVLSVEDKKELKEKLQTSDLAEKSCDQILVEYRELIRRYLADRSEANLEKVIDYCSQEDEDAGREKPDAKCFACSKLPQYQAQFQMLEDSLNADPQ